MLNSKKIGHRIKERREELNISAEELAEMIGLHKASIYRYENGEVKGIKLPVIESIAIALRINPDYLVGKSNEKITYENLEKPNEKDVTTILNTTKELLLQDGLMFDGKPVTQESINSILSAMEIGIALAEKKIKEKEK